MCEVCLPQAQLNRDQEKAKAPVVGRVRSRRRRVLFGWQTVDSHNRVA
jgi:hypothetical protein